MRTPNRQNFCSRGALDVRGGSRDRKQAVRIRPGRGDERCADDSRHLRDRETAVGADTDSASLSEDRIHEQRPQGMRQLAMQIPEREEHSRQRQQQRQRP